MKKIFTNQFKVLSILLLILISTALKLNAQCNTTTGIVNIPDANFKAYLIAQNTIN